MPHEALQNPFCALKQNLYAARVSAANGLLDRGYGKPAVKEEIEAIDLPPVVIQIKAPDHDDVC